MMKGVILSLVGLLGGSAFAQDAPDFRVQIVVVDEVCLDADTVEVHLSAQTDAADPLQYVWDLNHDGSWDTAPSMDPDQTITLPDEFRAAVMLGAREQAGDRARDRLEFPTRHCE
jgi:hypothetical protein